MTPPAADAQIVWAAGGTATVVHVDGVLVTVRSSKPFPPGAPVDGVLRDDAAWSFTLKVAATRRVEDGLWEVRGRLLSATTDVRAAFGRAPPPGE